MSSATTFRFTDEAPEQQLFTDIQNLNAFSDEQVVQFISISISFLSQASSDSSQAKVEEFAQEHNIKMKPLTNTLRALLYFFSESLKRNMQPDHISEDLVKLGLSSERASTVSKAWQSSFQQMSVSMIGKTLSVNQLVDMEWKFGVTAASDELSKVGACFLQLKLVIDKGDGKTEDVLMELTLPQFYQFLREMNIAAHHCQ